MKLNHYDRQILSNGGETSQFTAKMNGAAFAILSSGIYEYKIAAFIRETMCNAFDSHVEAGKEDIPIKVQLPNQWKPVLRIEDRGIGLDDDGVRRVFASYFESTKSDTNDVTGGMGIGAKSVFAYSSSFTIIAIRGGVQRRYSAYIGTDGIPMIQIMHEDHTDAENGVTIEVPIQENDINTVVEEFRVIGAMFPTLPEVTGVSGEFEFVCDDVHEQINEKGYAFTKPFVRSDLYCGDHDGEIFAIMGNVLYSLPHQYFQLNNGEILSKIRGRGRNMLIPFDIGELSPAASRETLSLDDNTKKALSDKIEKLGENEKKSIENKINQHENMISAYRWAEENFTLFKSLLSWNGIPLNRIMQKELKIPYECEMSHVGTRGYRGNRVRRPMHYFKVKQLAEAPEVRAFYVENVKKTRAKTLIRQLIDIGELAENTIILLFNRKLSKVQSDRVEGYLSTGLVWESTDSLANRLKKDSTGRQYGSVGASYDRGEKSDDTLYCKTYENGVVTRIHHHKIDPNATYVFGYDYESYTHIDDDLKVIIKTRRVEEYIEENKIPHWVEVMRQRGEAVRPLMEKLRLNHLLSSDGVLNIYTGTLLSGKVGAINKILLNGDPESSIRKALEHLLNQLKLEIDQITESEDDISVNVRHWAKANHDIDSEIRKYCETFEAIMGDYFSFLREIGIDCDYGPRNADHPRMLKLYELEKEFG